ncbi:ABC transporter ATP-binding protein [Novosphingobium sp. MD-1]|uniref:ABC transporter ATP-binding protein n=1 Tax=Novosphingobium sp. MD-1 TaxID=1630648 RepID=UPI00061C938C|nr:ABC transporter ATP-binding protein [Novosphingobium sp. MD-1]GAO54890.1 capsular polysaccharide ABC transporter, ATP-binding protein kpsT [Novosphingobium sp. MD-1]
MIWLSNIHKEYVTRKGRVQVLRDVCATIAPGQKLGILGRNGAGKSTLIRIISGAEMPTSGSVTRSMSVSWPLAFGGAFQGSLTGLDNMRFICRIYGTDATDKIEFVEEFSELGLYLKEPVRTYSSGMRARLAFAISMIVEFDCFLIDEVVAVGDAKFHQKCHVELFEKRGDRAKIFVSHDTGYVREHCDSASVLIDGKLTHFEDVGEALDFYARGQTA